VAVEFCQQGAAQGDEDHRDDDDGEDGVGGEQDEINGANPALALEDSVADTVVVEEIGDEENGGDGECGNHEALVDLDLAVADGGVAAGQKNAASAVEDGVKCCVRDH